MKKSTPKRAKRTVRSVALKRVSNSPIRKTVYTLVIISILSVGAYAFASGSPTFNQNLHLNLHECDKTGSPVVNAEEKVANDADSGQAGNYWALDTFTRHIKIWAQKDGTYCASVSYAGLFDAQPGVTSPGGTGTLTGTEDGRFDGGYRAIITGTFKTNPLWPTKGSIGKPVDYRCDIEGNCPGYSNWTDQYFDAGYTFDYGWWGWIYRTSKNIWTNSSDGNSGDII